MEKSTVLPYDYKKNTVENMLAQDFYTRHQIAGELEAMDDGVYESFYYKVKKLIVRLVA
jgi:hypothetical protein